jgi:hypothetical protein
MLRIKFYKSRGKVTWPIILKTIRQVKEVKKLNQIKINKSKKSKKFLKDQQTVKSQAAVPFVRKAKKT